MIQLQRLRIPPGWEVVINKFLDADVTQYSSDNNIWMDMTQDILHIRCTRKKSDIAIDLGWYPDNDPKGAFHLLVIKNGDWEKPLEEFDSRNKDDIVETMEAYLLKY